jgi:hypothetical protein
MPALLARRVASFSRSTPKPTIRSVQIHKTKWTHLGTNCLYSRYPEVNSQQQWILRRVLTSKRCTKSTCQITVHSQSHIPTMPSLHVKILRDCESARLPAPQLPHPWTRVRSFPRPPSAAPGASGSSWRHRKCQL